MSKIKIFERPDGQRYWVVRASGGEFVDHFRKDGIVAIGHINHLNVRESTNEPYFPELKPLRMKMENHAKRSEGKISERQAFNHFNQTKTFLAEISIGDIVVTIDSSQLMIGRVTGYPFISNKSIRVVYDGKKNRGTEMDFHLRRKVQWGPVIPRNYLPLAMKRSISARQTVFNIDEYWYAIYHLLYPIFVADNRIYFSARIKQKEAINSYSVSQIFGILTEMEVFISAFEEIAGNENVRFETLFNRYYEENGFNLSTIAEFMSPGSIWSSLGLDDNKYKKVGVALLIYTALFGADLGVISTDGIIDVQSRQRIVEHFLKRLETRDIAKTRESLKLDIPDYNTKPLEDNSKDETKKKHADTALALLDNYYS